MNILKTSELPFRLIFSVLAAVLFVSPVVLSVENMSTVTNYSSGLYALCVAVFLVLIYQFEGERIEIFSIKENRVLLFLFVMFSILWVAGGMPVIYVYGYLTMCCMVVLFIAMTEVFRRDEGAFLILLRVKSAVVVGVGLFFLLFIYLFQDPELAREVKAAPPVYRHLRHLNYDLFFALPVLVLLLKNNLRTYLVMILLFATCLVAIWTAGRGMALALLAAFGLARLRYWRAGPTRLELVCGGILILSVLVLMFSGKTLFLDLTTSQTVGAETVNKLSSGRIKIWMASLDMLSKQDLYSQLFGLGPDAFARHGAWRAGIVQPHGSLVQILLEFGATGLLLFVALMVSLIKKAIFLVVESPSDTDVLAAVLLVGGLVFSLVDGIFYHTVAMVMMVLLIAFVSWRYQVLKR